jgi:hypothetical protein
MHESILSHPLASDFLETPPLNVEQAMVFAGSAAEAVGRNERVHPARSRPTYLDHRCGESDHEVLVFGMVSG